MITTRTPPSRPPPRDSAAEGLGWRQRLQRLFVDLRALASDHVELALLETQRAGQVLVQTVAAAVGISVLLATAWLGLVAALVVWLTDAGMSWPVALIIGALTCVALAGVIALWVKKNIPDLMFSATLRQLRATRAVPDNVDVDLDLDLGRPVDPAPATAVPPRPRQAHEGPSA